MCVCVIIFLIYFSLKKFSFQYWIERTKSFTMAIMWYVLMTMYVIFSPLSPLRHCTNLPTLVLTFTCDRHKDNIISASYAYDLLLVEIKIFFKIENRGIFLVRNTQAQKMSAFWYFVIVYVSEIKWRSSEISFLKVQLCSSRWYLGTPDKFAIWHNIFQVILSPKIAQKSLSESFAKFSSNCGDIRFQYSREISGSCRRRSFFLRKRR